MGLQSNVVELTPPLILSASQAQEAIAILDKAIEDVEQGRVADDLPADFKGW